MSETLFYVKSKLKAASIVKIHNEKGDWWKATAILSDNSHFITLCRTKVEANDFIKEIQNVRKDF